MQELAVTNSDILEVFNIFSLPSMQTQKGLAEFERMLEVGETNMGHDPFPLFEDIADGAYTRELHLKKGHFAVGAVHKKECLSYMLTGKILIASPDGVKLLEAPLKFKTPVGNKNIGYIIEDSVWIDIYATDKKTPFAAGEELFCESVDDVGLDYQAMLAEMGYSEEQSRAIVEDSTDLIEAPEASIIEIKESEIEGNGAFLTEDVPFRGTIGTARIGTNRTPLGRYTNHSFIPNAEAVCEGDVVYFVARKALSRGDEVTVDYRKASTVAAELDKLMGH